MFTQMRRSPPGEPHGLGAAPVGPAPRPPSRQNLAATVLAALLGAAAMAALLFALGAVHGSSPSRAPTVALSPAEVVNRYESGLTASVERAFDSTASIDVVTAGGEQGAGTGIVVSARGLVLTNYHVVKGADRIFVTLGVRPADVPADATVVAEPPPGDPRGATIIQVRGSLVAASPTRDLAVVKVPLHGLVPIPLGDARDLRLGERVIAIGNALALTGAPTVTSGVISGFRDLESESGERYPQAIQTDASINQGNSGGPLVDSAGRLVGINTLAASAGTAENVGFAIQVNKALPLIRRAAR